MGVGTGTRTERDWTLYGFQTYYALLNCGFPLQPSAGTANGVHPVPLGFNRVYVHLDGPFSHDAWMRGLAAGRSFVTTGPMLLATVDRQDPGATLPPSPDPRGHRIEGTVFSEQPLESLEMVVNGEIVQRFEPQNRPTPEGARSTALDAFFLPETSSWLALRCIEQRPGGRLRFAHTAPWHFPVAGKPLTARRQEADWLVRRVEEEIRRSQGMAPEDLLTQYRKALAIYQRIAANAR